MWKTILIHQHESHILQTTLMIVTLTSFKTGTDKHVITRITLILSFILPLLVAFPAPAVSHVHWILPHLPELLQSLLSFRLPYSEKFI